MSISRRTARECALKTLYSFDFNREADPSSFFALVCAEGDVPHDAFAESLFLGVVEKREEIDQNIEANAKGWKLSRISRMSLSIMRLCAYELLYVGTPKPVAINEAVELAKLYDTDDAPAFVNGILNAMLPNDTKKAEAVPAEVGENE